MTSSYDKRAAIVVLPPAGAGRLADRDLSLWLSRGDLSRRDGPQFVLRAVLDELGLAAPASGLAALRLWGQTGDRPARWMAGADPVYLEPRLDHLVLHAPDSGELAPEELRRLFDHLQATLGGSGGIGFGRVGAFGYVTAEEAIATADLPAMAVNRRRPDDFLPRGDRSSAYRRLLSEVEMALHEHPVNRQRVAEGRMPVNSLWLWGGGIAPEPETRPLPPLFADDPLLAGSWLRHRGVAETWPGNIAACADASVAGFVAVLPRREAGAQATVLQDLRHSMQAGRLRRVILLFRDGIRADLKREHGLRVWRHPHPWLKPGESGT